MPIRLVLTNSWPTEHPHTGTLHQTMTSPTKQYMQRLMSLRLCQGRRRPVVQMALLQVLQTQDCQRRRRQPRVDRRRRCPVVQLVLLQVLQTKDCQRRRRRQPRVDRRRRCPVVQMVLLRILQTCDSEGEEHLTPGSAKEATSHSSVGFTDTVRKRGITCRNPIKAVGLYKGQGSEWLIFEGKGARAKRSESSELLIDESGRRGFTGAGREADA
mmetsp:Transcript_39598/g.86280  ORF Transcript_39598/g.86280 Transcript_39598/m.86280 type:complete len:214 (-) Transcript_39598:69-710(-)